MWLNLCNAAGLVPGLDEDKAALLRGLSVSINIPRATSFLRASVIASSASADDNSPFEATHQKAPRMERTVKLPVEREVQGLPQGTWCRTSWVALRGDHSRKHRNRVKKEITASPLFLHGWRRCVYRFCTSLSRVKMELQTRLEPTGRDPTKPPNKQKTNPRKQKHAKRRGNL